MTGHDNRTFGPVTRRASGAELPDDSFFTDDTPAGLAFHREHGFWPSRRPFDAERTRQRLRDIAEQVADARALVEGGKEAFDAETFDGTMRRRTAERIVEIVAEASAKLHSDYKTAVQAPWRQMYGMRTLVVHHYDRTDPELLWEVLTAHLPDLARTLRLPADPDPGPVGAVRATQAPSVRAG